MKARNILQVGFLSLLITAFTGCTKEGLTYSSSELNYVAGKANVLNFHTSLKGSNEVPSVDSMGAGEAHMRLSKDEDALYFKVTVANLDNVIQSHIHMGPAGSNGPVVAFLFGPAPQPSGPQNGVLAEGVITVSELLGPLAGDFEGLVNALRAGDIYVNVHTTAFPGGELRGQL